MSGRKTCETCRWWGEKLTVSDEPALQYCAPCLRFPPHPFRTNTHNGTHWPKTKPFDYCGEHQSRAVEP
jgi:hypothetical protein